MCGFTIIFECAIERSPTVPCFDIQPIETTASCQEVSVVEPVGCLAGLAWKSLVFCGTGRAWISQIWQLGMSYTIGLSFAVKTPILQPSTGVGTRVRARSRTDAWVRAQGEHPTLC